MAFARCRMVALYQLVQHETQHSISQEHQHRAKMAHFARSCDKRFHGSATEELDLHWWKHWTFWYHGTCFCSRMCGMDHGKKKKILFRSPSTPCLQICLQPPGFTKEHTMSNPMRLLDFWHSIGRLSGKISMKLTKRMVGKNSNNCLTYFQYHPMSFHAMIPQMHGCQPLLNLTPKLERELMQSQLRNWNSFQGKPSPASLMFAICIRTVFQSGLWLQRFAPWIRLRVRCHCLHKANLHPEPDLPTLCFSLVYPSLEIHVNVVSSTNNRYASRPWKFDSSMQCTGDHRTMSDQRRSSNGSCPWIFLAQFFHAVAFRKEMLLVFWLCWPLPFYGPVLSTINS